MCVNSRLLCKTRDLDADDTDDVDIITDVFAKNIFISNYLKYVGCR